MTEAFVETPADRAENKLSLVAAILLGIAATLTAISAYQAALTDGDALQGYSSSNAALSDANFFYNTGNQIYAADQAQFVQYATVAKQGDGELAIYIQSLMRPGMSAAIDWWLDSGDEVTTPFDDVEGNPYVIDELAAGDEKGAEATKLYKAGVKADKKGDKFELSTVLLALTLFFGGIATLFRRRRFTVALLCFATVSLVGGAIVLGGAFAA